MSLERAIRDLWSADFRLTALVPIERVFTGEARGRPPLPYVVLSRDGNRPAVRTSSGRTIDETRLRFGVWAAGLDQAKRIAAEIARRFDRQAFEAAGVVCHVMRRHDDAAAPQASGAWRLTADYRVLNEQPQGV